MPKDALGLRARTGGAVAQARTEPPLRRKNFLDPNGNEEGFPEEILKVELIVSQIETSNSQVALICILIYFIH